KHYKKVNIDLGELKYYLLYLSIGDLKGSIIAKYINTELIKMVFAILLFGSGILMIIYKDNKVIKLTRSARYSIFR
ncbi:sulfite exporter TauE/SafE family protein, partial [Francisella tularensis subsp. holarctica]